jgi:protoheme ferro-lyase
VNDKTNSANQPNIHRKTLHSKFNEYNSYIKDLDDDVIIENLKKINRYIGMKSYIDIYTKQEEQIKQANKNAWDKSNEIKFYLGFKNTNFTIDNIIKNINNPDIFN